MICPNCHRDCAPTARHCTACGARLVAPASPSGDTPAGASAGGGAGSGAYAAEAAHAAAVGVPLPPGTLLHGHYRVTRVLGAGAFGRVYLAEDLQATQGHDPSAHLLGGGLQGHAAAPHLAIKELLDKQFASAEAKRDAITWFKREVSTLLTLEHRGIPAIHSYWTAQPAAGPFYLAMDYIPGPSLHALAHERAGPLPWRQAVAWSLDLCDILTYLHSRTPPYVFRDLKPPNVIVDSRADRPVLIDFGIARQLASTSGTAIGTWGYMPYEQILGKAETRSDLYALGATLHMLLSGRHPEAEYSRLQRDGLDVEGILRALFPPIETLAPDLPPALCAAVARATAFEAQDRFPTAEALAEALRAVIAAHPPPAPPQSGPAHGSAQSGPTAAAAAQNGPAHHPVESGAAPPVESGPPASGATGAAPLLVVSAHGQGAYTQISAALRDAPPGARIEVRPGLYAESLVIEHDVEIAGTGHVDEIVVESAEAPCLLMRAEAATLRGLTLRRHTDGQTASYAVDLPGGSPVLEDCVITSASLAAVAIHGPTAAPALRRCRIHDGASGGVLVYDHGRGTLEDCDISANTLAGLEIRGGGHPTVRHCAIHDGRAGGIVVHDGGRGMIENCTIYGNALAGVEIREEGDPTLRRCAIRDGQTAGVLVCAEGHGTLEDCDIAGNVLSGIEIAEGGNPLLRRCAIHDNTQCGLLVYAHGRGTLEDCDISANALTGVEVAEGGNPALRRCAIHDGGQGGVLVHSEGEAVLHNCAITANALAGVEARERGNAMIRGCHINRHESVAIYVHQGGIVAAEESDLTGNAHGAWRIEAGSQIHRQGNLEG